MKFNEEGYAFYENGELNQFWTRAHEAAREIFKARRARSGITKSLPPWETNSQSLGVQETAVFDQISNVVRVYGVEAAIPEAERLAHSLATQYGLAQL